MRKFISSFSDAFRVAKQDKVIILFSLIPVFIGLALFFLAGTYVYGDMVAMGEQYIQSKIESSVWSSFFSWLLIGLLTIGLYFIISWTFVLIVSLLASPFNDMISNRVEKVLDGERPPSISESFGRMLKRLGFTLINEVKKLSFIIIFSVFGFLLSFIPVLAPISILISACLLAVEFIDYSWSRHSMEFRQCLSDVRKNFLGYSITGSIFLTLVAIPVVNFFVLPYAVIYYTVVFVKNEPLNNRQIS